MRVLIDESLPRELAAVLEGHDARTVQQEGWSSISNGELLRRAAQAGGIRRGTLKPARVTKFKPADVKALRSRLGQSQTEFALMIGVSVATLRNWEQGRRRPEGPALALLRVATRNPLLVAKALHGTPKRGTA